MNRWPNWNWDDGTPEDGPRPADMKPKTKNSKSIRVTLTQSEVSTIISALRRYSPDFSIQNRFAEPIITKLADRKNKTATKGA